MTPGKILQNKFLVACGERWPDTVRLEETGVGDAVPIAFVQQAIACIESGNPKAAIPLLRKRVKFGIKGQPDLSGFLIREISGERIPVMLACEIKAGKDRVSEDQARHHQYLRDFGVIVIIVRTVEQGIAELAKYADR